MEYLKVVTLIRRRTDLTLADFSHHWRTVHKQHALALVEAGYFQGYIQNHRIDVELDGWESVADGSPELWVADPSALSRLLDSPEYRHGAGPDEANFMTLPALSMVAREEVLVEAESSQFADDVVKVMLLVKRAPGLTQEQFAQAWLQGRAPLLLPGARPLKLTRHAALPGGDTTTFDGAEFSWWPNLDSFRRQWAMRDQSAGQGVVEIGPAQGLIAREEWVVRPD